MTHEDDMGMVAEILWLQEAENAKPADQKRAEALAFCWAEWLPAAFGDGDE